MEEEVYFSIITPTYNRGPLLERVYESLLIQKFQNFEWLIIDDGSTDNTFELVSGWAKNSKFNINYYYQENCGKHIAYNSGVRESCGIFVIVLDSDDELTGNALLKLYNLIENIGKSKVKLLFSRSISSSLCDIKDEFIVFNDFYVNLYHKGKLHDECLPCISRDEALENLFPDSKGIFVLEGFVWLKVGTKNRMYLTNIVTRIYHHNSSNTLSNRIKSNYDYWMEFVFIWRLVKAYAFVNKSISLKFLVYILFYFLRWIKNIRLKNSN